MKIANIADIKNRLSYYLERVKRGETVLVMDRRTPVARIVPLGSPAAMEPEERRAWLRNQVEAGVLRPGHGEAVADIVEFPPEGRHVGASAALIRERRRR